VSTSSKVDLHLHTTRSDGRLSPTELVRLLVAQGVATAAITDHDSTEGLDEAFAEAARQPGLRLISGIEVSADHPSGGGDLHVLGYFMDYHDREFQERLRTFRSGRVGRIKQMVDKLAELGLPLEWERVQELAAGASIGRPHIAQAMVERGYISTSKEAFNGYLEDGGKAHFNRPHIPMEEAVRLIQSVGGVAVLAHPVYVRDWEALLPRLVGLGIVGMEVHYSEFSPEQRRGLAHQARKYHLLPCGGSDYHALGQPGEFLPGSAGPPDEVVNSLEELAKGRRAIA